LSDTIKQQNYFIAIRAADIILKLLLSAALDAMKLIFAVLYVSLNDGLYTLL